MTDTLATSKLIHGRTGAWEIVMGLEIHAQVASKAKLFSGAAVGFGAGPNEQVSLIDAGFPGMLPTLNKHCVEQAVKTGLGLNAAINRKSQFDRKNYFYPDLPQGYQISQLYFPIVGEGVVEVEAEDGSFFNVGIERLHLEQDAGKLIHDLSHRELCRPEPRGHGPDGDRLASRHPVAGRGRRLRQEDPHHPDLSRYL